jgi:hypothetical protein
MTGVRKRSGTSEPAGARRLDSNHEARTAQTPNLTGEADLRCSSDAFDAERR